MRTLHRSAPRVPAASLWRTPRASDGRLVFGDGAVAVNTPLRCREDHAVTRLGVGMALRAFYVKADVLFVAEGNGLFHRRLGRDWSLGFLSSHAADGQKHGGGLRNSARGKSLVECSERSPVQKSDGCALARQNNLKNSATNCARSSTNVLNSRGKALAF